MSSKVATEAVSWRTTAIVMLVISAAVFLTQRFVVSFLDPIFEFCIFHLTALFSVVIYLSRQKGDPQSDLTNNGK